MILPSIANPWVLLGALVAAGAIATTAYIKGGVDGRQEKQAEMDRADKQRAFESLKNMERVRESEDILAAKDAERRTQDAQAIDSLNRSVADLTRRLSERPSRPPATSVAQGACAGPDRGTGAGLYREDGLFLAGEAAAAKRIVVQRDTCYVKYEALAAELARLQATQPQASGP